MITLTPREDWAASFSGGIAEQFLNEDVYNIKESLACKISGGIKPK